MILGLFTNRSHYMAFIVCLIQVAYTNPSDQVIQQPFDTCNCSLTVKDNVSEYARFRELTRPKTIRVIFFNLTIDNKNLQTDHKNHDFYGWVREDAGIAMISLSTDYIATGLNLYAAFTHEQSFNLIESNQGCYARLTNDSQKMHIVFTTLLQFTNLNQGCYGQNCSTICWRRFNREDIFLNHNVSYSCCNRETINPKINVSTCLVPPKQLWYGPAVQIISIILSLLMAATLIDKLFNNFLQELGSYRYFRQESLLTSDQSQTHQLNQLLTNNSHQESIQNSSHQSLLRSSHQMSGAYLRCSICILPNSTNLLQMVKVRILDTLHFQNVNYLYFSDYATKYHWLEINHCIKLLSFIILSGGLGFLSIIVQRNSTLFIVMPRFYQLEKFHNIKELGLIIAVICVPYILILIVAYLKQVWSSDSKKLFNQSHANDQELLSRQTYLTPSNDRQSYHQIKIILVDMKRHLLSLQLFQFIKDLLTFIICLPFCMFGLIGLLRAFFFISELLTFKLKGNLLPKRANWPLAYRLMSVIMTIYSVFFVIFTASLLIGGLQLIIRIFITMTTFIFAFSTNFNVIIVIMIPYSHHIYLLLSAYSNRGPLICHRIIAVKSRIEENIQTILESKQGYLRVNFIIAENNSINNVEFDIPEMLNEEIIKKSIEDCIKRSLRDGYHHAINGTSSIIFHYSRNESDNNKVTVKLLQCGFGCVKCTFDNGYSTLTGIIEAHLQNRDSHYFRTKLTPTYYDIYENGTHQCTGIPAELYDYLKYYTSEISISPLQVAFNILIVTGLFFYYIITFFLVYEFRSISSLNSIIANTSIAYLATTLTLKYFKLFEIKNERIDKILILNITQYRRGYKIFFKRGVEFQPISQMISMAVR
ncbi:hypothetical protein TrispH2_008792 [Trichoplax sp. H2]|uniref:Uncharacterized protein n=1 Tax=Trichoplax adhaerens TaxID=10228 RepID=B3S8I3_TRIAD|nr:predicted protein [Trichoplax adhaerens]EDV20958.1 predicted protein [Trichoplax adhaerens]RDD39957.1 hypothetical protein TrispH2_008792 [Trichoplax sp. H2]|eukprot:XP_002116602.1 predicted protein [Trichoplax adhaerens]